MPTMWFVKDGPRPYSQRGLGTPVTFDEIEAIFGSYQMHYAGSEAPSINAGKPSHSIKNVVFEVEESEGTSSFLPKPGFYLVVGCSPDSAERDLLAHRGLV
jgi:hypothetical protein